MDRNQILSTALESLEKNGPELSASLIDEGCFWARSEPEYAAIKLLAASNLASYLKMPSFLSELASIVAEATEPTFASRSAIDEIACDAITEIAEDHARADIDFFTDDFERRARQGLDDLEISSPSQNPTPSAIACIAKYVSEPKMIDPPHSEPRRKAL